MKYGHFHMCKPRVRTQDVKEIKFYNGYWLLDLGDDRIAKLKNVPLRSMKECIEEIDYQITKEDILKDIEELKLQHNTEQTKLNNLNCKIMQKFAELETLLGNNEEDDEDEDEDDTFFMKSLDK